MSDWELGPIDDDGTITFSEADVARDIAEQKAAGAHWMQNVELIPPAVDARPRWLRRKNKKRPAIPEYFHGGSYANNFNYYGFRK